MAALRHNQKPPPWLRGSGDRAKHGGRGALGDIGFLSREIRMSNERPYRLALLGTSPVSDGGS